MRIAIVAEGDFKRDNRLLKIARSLTQRGDTVARFGIRITDSQQLCESTDEGEIILIITGTEDSGSSASVAQERPAGGGGLNLLTVAKRMAARFGPTDDLRHYLGRQRECSLIYQAVRSWSPDAVICVNPTMMRVGAWAQRELGALFIYDAHEIWIEMYPRHRKVLRALYSRLERRLARRCDLTITVNDEIAGLMARRMGIEKPMVLMNGPSECLPPTPVHAPLRLLFQGALEADRDLTPIIEQMGALRDLATLTIQGFGGMEDYCRSIVRERGLEDVVRFVPPCAPSDVLSHANEHDVGLIVYALTSENIIYSSPNKFFDYIGAGLALLAVDAPVMRRFITSAGCGDLLDPSDIGNAWKVIEALAANPERVHAMKEAAARLCPTLLWDAEAAPLLDWIAGRELMTRDSGGQSDPGRP